jgi:hypothetical protein
MTITKAFAVAGAVALVATPLAAKPLFDAPQGKAVEVVRPSAAGEPKRYTAQVTATCNGGSCVAKFGKKSGKVRTIEVLTCLIYSDGQNILAGVNLNPDDDDAYEFFIPPASAEVVGNVTYSIFTWTKNFQVASGLPFNVALISSGDAAIFGMHGEWDHRLSGGRRRSVHPSSPLSGSARRNNVDAPGLADGGLHRRLRFQRITAGRHTDRQARHVAAAAQLEGGDHPIGHEALQHTGRVLRHVVPGRLRRALHVASRSGPVRTASGRRRDPMMK